MNSLRHSFRHYLPAITLVALVWTGCSDRDSTTGYALVSGTILIESEMDEDLPDYSGTGLLVMISTEKSPRDTLFKAITDVDGHFNAVAKIPERGSYPLVISRNNRVLHIATVVLSPTDTVNITGTLPNIERTLRVSSFENDAMATYERLQRLYGRVATFAYGGSLQQDTIPVIMNQWSDLFWSMREEYPGSYASELAASDAIGVLEGWNDEKVLERLDELENISAFFQVKLTYGGHLHARNHGLESGLHYLDRMRSAFRSASDRRAIDMRRIELLLDFEENDRALDEARNLASRAGSDEALKEWASDVVYKLEYLAPGRTLPNVSFTVAGDTVSLPQSADASYFMIEVVLLSDRNYQQVYPELVRMRRSTPETLLAMYTIPLDRRQITIDAFFEERERRWTIADAGSHEAGSLLDILRIEQVPTRILARRDGTIIGRYVAHEIESLQNDLQSIIETVN